MVKREWIKQKDDFIRENYLELSNIQMGIKLDNTPYSIGYRLKKLGLKRPKELVYQMIHSEEANKKRFHLRLLS